MPAVSGRAAEAGGRGRCCRGREASIIPLLASMPFLVALSFLAAVRLGAEGRRLFWLFLFAPASLAGNSRRPPPRGQGRTGLRARQQAFVNGPRLPGRAAGGRPPRRADSHWLDTVVLAPQRPAGREEAFFWPKNNTRVSPGTSLLHPLPSIVSTTQSQAAGLSAAWKGGGGGGWRSGEQER